MIIYNFKLNKKAIFKTILGIMAIICISLGIAALYNVLNSMEQQEENILPDCSIKGPEIANIQPENYTNILKAVHENIDTYIGQKISFTGYIYKIEAFSKDQFVLARDMDIGNHQTVIVGFLCSSEKAQEFPNYTWVTITGEITKGYYNGDMPIIKILEIKETTKPENPTVPVPNDEYVPTSIIY